MLLNIIPDLWMRWKGRSASFKKSIIAQVYTRSNTSSTTGGAGTVYPCQ